MDSSAAYWFQFVDAQGYSRILLMFLYALLAWIGTLWLPRLVSRTMLTAAQARRSRPLSAKRRDTIDHLSRDLTLFLVVGTAVIASLALFVDTRGLFTFLGLFSAAFGLGARPLVSDYMSGAIYLFEDLYAIGDKVELIGIEGTVEDIRLRTTTLRAPTGELFFVPNGEIRQVRNFARGSFSDANVQLRIPAAQLDDALAVLDDAVIKARANIQLLLEQPRVITADQSIGDTVEVTIVAKASYGHGPEVRRRLMHEVQHALNTLKIHVTES
jgi:small-conductance mechanosensitive channel